MQPGILPQLASPLRGMAKLDRLGWTSGLTFVVYGARIGVRSNDDAALDALLPHFPPHWKLGATPRVDWLYSLSVAPSTCARKLSFTLYSNAERRVRARDLGTIQQSFEQDAQLAVAQTARGKTFVHAGVVGWRGRAIVIPGKTYSGKSTLVHELVRAGAIYYSDEYAVLDARGRAHPFARPLGLRGRESWMRRVSLAELEGLVGKKPLPVGTVLVTTYRARAKWQPKVLTPGAGVLELLANTVTARTKQKEALRTLARVTTQATIVKGTRGEAKPFAAQILAGLS